VSPRKAAGLDDLVGVLRALRDWPDDAACYAAPVEAVDITPDEAEAYIWRYCHHCPVVGRCRELGDAGAPYAWRSVYGAAVFEPRAAEPRYVTNRSNIA
jgi:hypothetical protein